MLYVARWRLLAAAESMGMRAEAVDPLMVVGTMKRVYTTPVEPPATRSVLAATVCAAWHLMQQPTLAGTWHEPADKKTARAWARAGREDPGVTVVDLRRLYKPTDPAHVPEHGRDYSHRWVVSGHWRQQPHGPNRSLRKRIWIPDYIKGPDGTPLLVREHVNVWRR